MSLTTDLATLSTDTAIIHNVVHGDSSTVVTTDAGEVRSLANIMANGMAPSLNSAAASATAASVSAAEALNSAGTAGEYSTALAAIASQTAIVPAATVAGFNGTVVASCIMDALKWSDGGAKRKQLQHTSWHNEVTTATGTWRGFVYSEQHARAKQSAAIGSNLITPAANSDFSAAGNWVMPAGVSIGGGSMSINSASAITGGFYLVNTYTGMSPNTAYEIVFSVTSYTSGSIRLASSGLTFQTTPVTGVGTYTATFVSAATGHLYLLTAANTNLSIDNISIKAIDTANNYLLGGGYYYNTADKLFYSLNATSGVTQVFRGSRAEMPEKILWTAEAGRVIGWDITDATMPMWMVFIGATTYALGGATCSCITSIDGTLITGDSTYDVHAHSFISDSSVRYVGLTTSSGSYQGNLQQRNAGLGFLIEKHLPTIASRLVNAVAATILPNAPIDQATGMPVPTIAVGTSAGVSVIKDDGTAVKSSNVNPQYAVAVDSNGYIYSGDGTLSNLYRSALPASQLAAGWTLSIFASPLSNPYILGWANKRSVMSGKNLSLGGFSGMSILRPNTAVPANSMTANLTTTQPPVWQVGDSRGCWGGSTVAETVVDTELVTNGTFNTDMIGWTPYNGAGGASAWNAGGWVDLTYTTGNAGMYQAIPTIIGKTYRLVVGKLGSAATVYVGTSAGGLQYTAIGNSVNDVAFQFVATSANCYVTPIRATPGTATIDNISVKECAADLSIKVAPLAVVGTLTKAAIATGAQLMSWSGFSAANYLEQASNANWNAIGTGDFSIRLDGVKWGTAGVNRMLFSIGDGVSDGSVRLFVSVTNILTFNIYNAAVYGNIVVSTALTDTAIHTVEVVRSTVNGVANTVQLRVDGEVIASAVSALTVSNTTAFLRVGENNNGLLALGWPGGSFSAISISATPTSAEQSKHIHNTMSNLYQPNAQCCLAGTANSVLGLSYDEGTELTSAITSTHVTRLKDLQAVSSEAISVGTPASVCSSNGYEFIGGSTGSRLYTPSQRLNEELARTREQRAAFGNILVSLDLTSANLQTSFDVALGYIPQIIYVNGLKKNITSHYTVSFDGFKYIVVMLSPLSAGTSVSILCTRSV